MQARYRRPLTKPDRCTTATTIGAGRRTRGSHSRTAAHGTDCASRQRRPAHRRLERRTPSDPTGDKARTEGVARTGRINDRRSLRRQQLRPAIDATNEHPCGSELQCDDAVLPRTSAASTSSGVVAPVNTRPSSRLGKQTAAPRVAVEKRSSTEHSQVRGRAGVDRERNPSTASLRDQRDNRSRAAPSDKKRIPVDVQHIDAVEQRQRQVGRTQAQVGTAVGIHRAPAARRPAGRRWCPSATKRQESTAAKRRTPTARRV